MTRRFHPHLLLAVILVELFDDQLGSFDFTFELLADREFFPIFLAASHEVRGRSGPFRTILQFLSSLG